MASEETHEWLFAEGWWSPQVEPELKELAYRSVIQPQGGPRRPQPAAGAQAVPAPRQSVADLAAGRGSSGPLPVGNGSPGLRGAGALQRYRPSPATALWLVPRDISGMPWHPACHVSDKPLHGGARMDREYDCRPGAARLARRRHHSSGMPSGRPGSAPGSPATCRLATSGSASAVLTGLDVTALEDAFARAPGSRA